ncbi:SRPBCC family protein [Mycolicibacterium thermoresistibile]|jgi:hypothetical protein|uniref:Polyketide cyclase / dehydrase and lipid transport n=2 Tax=Mycolicibacterium thermoresistibile TaxID=1797 RepID=G7CCA8_MYCT3|nr:SRPBCC family protein [Mycolicibacterium thermoresistibile]EHI14371.1 hypothetical protein KEK_03016 [Mycolicibacterium thermoresistibile ATCC 19527]MCV7189535.1 SRPBCC family protein [Mycolicibacterium thermoresistibile]GAT14523.1 polyketide cyclase / dehydrase and lipid transport [Mycolicibacterium thermoresistibile]SNW19753.1 polyketide cyclase / dehydrase and lipid transport [Mycolicibacterium thermoresistibile]
MRPPEPLNLEQSRAIPVDVETAYHGTMSLPLPTLFRHRYGPIPPVAATHNETGGWGAAGDTRTVALTGGGTMHEELTRVDPPRSFEYHLSRITGPLSPLVHHIDGRFRFEPVGTGTEVTWRWALHPRSVLATPVLPVFARLWRGYARRALEVLSDELLTGAGE